MTTATGHHAVARALEPSARGTDLFILMTVVLIIAWLFVLIRAYVRFCLIKNVAADDWLMFASVLVYTGYSIDGMYGIYYGGTGRHMAELSIQQIYIGLKGWYIAEVLYAPLSAMIRTSVALFLLRVSVVHYHKWIIISSLVAIYTLSVVFLFVAAFQCDPPSYFYDQALGLEGRCVNITVVPYVTIAHSAVGAVGDLIFATLPIAMLWNVQLNRRTKAVVAMLLGMGVVAGIALLVRIPYIKILGVSPDFLFETIDVAIWSILELSLGIIAGCLATMRPLFKGFGIGHNTTREYPDEFVSASSNAARSTDRHRSLPFAKSGDGMSPSTLDMELASTGLGGGGDDAGSTHSSTRPLTLHLDALAFQRPSVKTNIVSARDSLAAQDVVDSGSRSISVHTTTVRTESISGGLQSRGEAH